MADIESIEVEILTGGEPDAGTDALVYLGLGGREFVLDNVDEDDFRRGDRNFFTLGRGSSVTHASTNDPRSPRLTFDDTDRHPVYVRLAAQVGSDSWLLENVWVRVCSDDSVDRYGRCLLDGRGDDHSLWLGIRHGTVLRLERER
ncbi:hypothetical protein [Streptomyces rimosus]|uniref:hypothetical protein n=1 Tax=Streptomyces rimosus TaxID=1927 RepID=UPI00067C6989|nr:hypothetical protein [Streptomyces rimosus]